MPSSGGEYVYLTQAYGPTWGFMTGWVSFFAGFSAPIAAGPRWRSPITWRNFSQHCIFEDSHLLFGSRRLKDAPSDGRR